MTGLQQLSGTLLLAIGVLCVVLPLADSSNGEIKHCRGVELKITDEQKTNLEACVKDAGANELKDIEPGKLPCFGVCIFKKSGMLDENGKPIKDSMIKLITEQMPEVVQPVLKNRTEECVSPQSTSMIDPKDETCSSYLPMLMCLHMAVLEECID